MRTLRPRWYTTARSADIHSSGRRGPGPGRPASWGRGHHGRARPRRPFGRPGPLLPYRSPPPRALRAPARPGPPSVRRPRQRRPDDRSVEQTGRQPSPAGGSGGSRSPSGTGPGRTLPGATRVRHVPGGHDLAARPPRRLPRPRPPWPGTSPARPCGAAGAGAPPGAAAPTGHGRLTSVPVRQCHQLHRARGRRAHGMSWPRACCVAAPCHPEEISHVQDHHRRRTGGQPDR